MLNKSFYNVDIDVPEDGQAVFRSGCDILRHFLIVKFIINNKIICTGIFQEKLKFVHRKLCEGVNMF